MFLKSLATHVQSNMFLLCFSTNEYNCPCFMYILNQREKRCMFIEETVYHGEKEGWQSIQVWA